MRALTAFLERELLALLSDAPPCPPVDGSEESESQSQSQSQQPPPVALAQLPRPRVVAVRRGRPAKQRLTLVDRGHALDAFVSHKALDPLGGDASALAGLRGSVVRIERYHFATPARVAALAGSAAQWAAPNARVFLWIDELSVIDKSDLAVNAAPAADESASVAALLRAMDGAQLETRLAVRQGLPPLPAPPVVARFDDAHPLLDDDCVIPEHQEAQLEAQDGWGLPAAHQPTDSQLIAENESGPWTQSQVGDVEPTAPAEEAAALNAEVEAPAGGEELEQAHDNDASQSAAESQGFQFAPEDVSETFLHCSDTESDSDTASETPSQRRRGGRRRKTEAVDGLPSEPLELPSESLELPSESLELPSQSLELPSQSLELPSQSLELPSESQAIDDAILVESQQESTQLPDDFGFQTAGLEGTQLASQATQDDFVPDLSGDGGFPQTQAPDTQDGFGDLDDETTDAAESQTQMPIEVMEEALPTSRDNALQEQAKASSSEVEEIVVDEAEENELSVAHEEQPPLLLPDSADAPTQSPRSRKRTRNVAPSTGESEAASTPPKAPVVIVIPDTPVNSRARKASRTTTASPSPSRKTRPRTAKNPPVSQADEQPAATSVPAPASQLAEDVSVAQSPSISEHREASPRPSSKPPALSQEVAPRQPKSVSRTRDAAALSAPKTPKAPLTVSTQQPSHSLSPAAETATPSAAELAIKSYFRTGVPLSIQQRVQQPRGDELLDFFRRPAEGDVGSLYADADDRQATSWSADDSGHPRTKQSSTKATASRWHTTGVL